MMTAVGGSLALISAAGCLDDDDDADDSNGTGDDPETLIESAQNSLEEAGDEFSGALDEANDPLSDSSHSIDTGPIETWLDAAEDDLSAARDGATDDQLETIAALEDVVDFFRDFADVFVALGVAMDEFETWEQYLDQDRWKDAVESAERAESSVDDAISNMTVARSTFDDIDTDALSDVSEIDTVEMERDLEEIEEILDVLGVLMTGSRQLSEGMIPFQDAIEALEQERFSVAASSFSSSASRFDAAYYTFSEAEDDAPAEFRGELIDMSCEMDALGDAAEHYSMGADLYADGDYSSGDEHFAEGEAAAERCDSDDVSLSL